jgi:hypothetical protein
MRPLLVLVSLLLAGCISGAEKSNLADDASVTVRGKALDGSGSPLVGGIAMLSTNNPFNLGGVTDVETGVDLRYKGATTDAKGGFVMHLRGGQAKNGAGQAQDYDLQVRTADTLDQPSVTRAVRFTTKDVQLVDFHMWDAVSADAATAGQITLGWTAPTDEKPTRYDVDVIGVDDGTVVYQPVASGLGAALPDYLLHPGQSYGYRVRAQMAYETRRSALHKFTAPAAANPKLLAVAAVRGVDGQPLAALTDDVLIGAVDVAGAFVVDLGSVQPVGKVVLVGTIAGSFQYQTSGDAGDFSAATTVAATGGAGWAELDLGTLNTARYVKITPVGDGKASPKPSSISEVRVLKP